MRTVTRLVESCYILHIYMICSTINLLQTAKIGIPFLCEMFEMNFYEFLCKFGEIIFI